MAKIKDNSKAIIAESDRLIKQKLEIAALMVERTAKQMCPVKTGTLKRSITHRINPDGRSAVVGSNVEYAPYVELGTHHKRKKFRIKRKVRMAAQPYLRPALESNRRRIERLFAK